MAGREELIQRTNALGQFLLQVNGIEIPHGNPQELNIEGCIVGFERFPSEIDGAHLHCTEGAGRSPTVAIAYFHWCLGWDLDQAAAYVKER